MVRLPEQTGDGSTVQGDPGPERLQDTYYVKRRHIMEAYGISPDEVRKLIKAGTLQAVHFVGADS